MATSQQRVAPRAPAPTRQGGKAPTPLAPAGTPPAPGFRSALGTYWHRARKTLKGRFVVLAACVVGMAVIQMVFISILFQRASTDLNTIANGSIPSINAAQAMTQYIEDIDAKSADFLAAAGLTDVFPCQIAGTNQN